MEPIKGPKIEKELQGVELPVCEHKGKWAGDGMAVINAKTSLLVITSVICVDCGKPTIDLTKIPLANSEKSSGIVTDSNPLGPFVKS